MSDLNKIDQWQGKCPGCSNQRSVLYFAVSPLGIKSHSGTFSCLICGKRWQEPIDFISHLSTEYTSKDD